MGIITDFLIENSADLVEDEDDLYFFFKANKSNTEWICPSHSSGISSTCSSKKTSLKPTNT